MASSIIKDLMNVETLCNQSTIKAEKIGRMVNISFYGLGTVNGEDWGTPYLQGHNPIFNEPIVFHDLNSKSYKTLILYPTGAISIMNLDGSPYTSNVKAYGSMSYIATK
jgi:hypothetical protein